MKHFDVKGNFMVYGPNGERRAAFALNSDRKLFEAAPDLLEAVKAAGSALAQYKTFSADVEAAKSFLIEAAKSFLKDAIAKAEDAS